MIILLIVNRERRTRAVCVCVCYRWWPNATQCVHTEPPWAQFQSISQKHGFKVMHHVRFLPLLFIPFTLTLTLSLSLCIYCVLIKHPAHTHVHICFARCRYDFLQRPYTHRHIFFRKLSARVTLCVVYPVSRPPKENTNTLFPCLYSTAPAVLVATSFHLISELCANNKSVTTFYSVSYTHLVILNAAV